jgi:hypothetical protein
MFIRAAVRIMIGAVATVSLLLYGAGTASATYGYITATAFADSVNIDIVHLLKGDQCNLFDNQAADPNWPVVPGREAYDNETIGFDNVPMSRGPHTFIVKCVRTFTGETWEYPPVALTVGPVGLKPGNYTVTWGHGSETWRIQPCSDNPPNCMMTSNVLKSLPPDVATLNNGTWFVSRTLKVECKDGTTIADLTENFSFGQQTLTGTVEAYDDCFSPPARFVDSDLSLKYSAAIGTNGGSG